MAKLESSRRSAELDRLGPVVAHPVRPERAITMGPIHLFNDIRMAVIPRSFTDRTMSESARGFPLGLQVFCYVLSGAESRSSVRAAIM